MKKELYIRPSVRAMSGYTPGEQPKDPSVIKLNTNENPYPPSPNVTEALADPEKLRLYPDPLATKLREEIAAYHGLTPDWVICANGSDDVLTMLARCFLDPDHALACPVPTYSLYQSLAEIQNAPCIRIPLNRDFSLPDDFEEKARNASIVMMANPNAPTGNRHPRERIARLCENVNGAVLIDEAYADFASEVCDDMLKNHSNMIISRTFSKSRALAGLRFGYALADPEIISQMFKVKDSYNLSRFTQASALAAFRDTDYLKKVVEQIKGLRTMLSSAFAGLGFDVVPSETNFIYAAPPCGDGHDFFQFLRAKNILVRYFPGEMTGKYVRITIGLPEQMKTLIAAAGEYVNQRSPK